MHGCQGAGCAPVATAFAGGSDQVVPVKPTGIAKSLAIGSPADGVYALDVARRTGGSIEAVDDERIVEGIRLLAAATGVFTETAGGVTAGVLRKLAERGEIGAGETVVVYITGDGLKTIDAVRPRRSRCRRHDRGVRPDLRRRGCAEAAPRRPVVGTSCARRIREIKQGESRAGPTGGW